MRILLIAYSCAPGLGSESGNSWHWALGLADRGHDVHVLTHVRERHRIGAAIETAPARFHFHGFEAQERLGMRLGYVTWHLSARQRAQRVIDDHGIDVVHHVSWATATAPTVASRLRCPVVWGPLGGGQRTPLSFWRCLGPAATAKEAARSAWVTAAPVHPGLRRTARRAEAVLSTNEETSTLLRRLGATSVDYMPQTGVDEEWLGAPAPPPDRPPEILWVGRLEPRKAPRLALEIFAGVVAVRPDAVLVIAGEGPLEGACRAWVAGHDLAHVVRFLGHVNQGDLRRRLAASHLMLFTSLRDSFPTVVFEALAGGVPLVALGHQALRSLPDGVSINVPVRSPAQARRDCIEAVVGLLDDPALRARLSAAARSYIEAGHLWSNRLDEAEIIYARVCAPG